MRHIFAGPTIPADPTAAELKKLLPSCSSCKKALDSHHYATLASTVTGEQEKPRVTQFLHHYMQHEWIALNQFNDFQSDRDILLAYSISCPAGGGMVAVVRSPYELYDRDELYLPQVISPEEQRAIAAALPPTAWHPF